MVVRDIAWPAKTHEILSHHVDSRAWNSFKFRHGDIVIDTYPKAGTTWTQQIVGQLIFGAPADLDVNALSKWLDFRLTQPEVPAEIARQIHRRFIKTHLPADAMVVSPRARYIYVARDGRDTAWSYHNHHHGHTDEFFAWINSGLPEGMPPIGRGPADPYEFYKTWLARDGYPIWPFWQHVRSWWALRTLPNVLLIHFNDLKTDLEGAIRRIAAFLEIELDEALVPRLVDHCSFGYMKRNAAAFAPRGSAAWKGGADSFINKGSNGRWRDRLTAEDVAAYEARAVAELGPDCARWLAEGGAIPD